MIELEKNKQLILFDGVCNLCNASVQYVIKHDKNDIFMFAPLQGEAGKKIIDYYHIDTSKIDSIILFKNNKKLYFKSTAALKIAVKLNFPINLLGVLLIIPSFIRNWVYSIIAKNRYKWYGKQNECMIPSQKLKAKFLN
ncbi:thiol-disulfide oxidoreductase DCC family protein [Xanthomarina sp. F2636L]|uniref:thiol-disulfide oxidoreductase DCC family protein n=1 Tax=Xanthomarina sp. F2636L TaxID=2996018 RepID=UPI00225DDD2C|nr:DCC1-like thiol-disulfide oxidoreductase family protein [Xanthomarina sp. F2636L]MCX7549698.1 DCC1-like thiol-disulfide oxidoreductase family protein [Xanthomarina sp. F2636L]